MADDNRKIWGAIAWGLGLIGLILVLVTDKKSDKELKFYGTQSVVFYVLWMILFFVGGALISILGVIPVISFLAIILGIVFIPVMFLVVMGVWLYGVWKAYQLEHFMLPIAGKLAEKFSAKL